MKSTLFTLLLILGVGGFQKIAEINEHTQKAEVAFKLKRYAEAVKNYEYLAYQIGDKDPVLLLNLAHAYRMNNQLDKARKGYEKCVKSSDPKLRSVAWEQMGTLSAKTQDYRQALTFYKRALVANFQNQQARYNYEMLKKYLREHPEEQNKIPPPAPEEKQPQEEKKPQPQEKQQQQNQSEQPDQDGDQEKENPDKPEKGKQQQKAEKQTNPESKKPQKQEKPGGENSKEKEQKQGEEKGNEEGQNLAENEDRPKPEKPNKTGGKETASGDEKRLQTQYDRLRKANISPEQAEMLLNAMKGAEQQYLQQLPKKGTFRQNPSKPDW